MSTETKGDGMATQVTDATKWISAELLERFPLGPFAVYSYYPATQREMCYRNQSPESACKLADREEASGCRVHVSLDTCG